MTILQAICFGTANITTKNYTIFCNFKFFENFRHNLSLSSLETIKPPPGFDNSLLHSCFWQSNGFQHGHLEYRQF